jgi:hypothetical protein
VSTRRRRCQPQQNALQKFVNNNTITHGPPRGKLWEKGSTPNKQYNNFVTGEAIPGYPILQKGNGKDSNIIEALSGITPFNLDPFPRMPAPTGPTSTRRRSTQSPLG